MRCTAFNGFIRKNYPINKQKPSQRIVAAYSVSEVYIYDRI